MAEPTRADARRNNELLLAVAREAFAEQGTDASLRDIARRAGVGIGTLYRHFPTREALLEALLRDGLEQLGVLADDLLAAASPRAALLGWLREQALGSTRYRGLPESVLAALRDETSPLHAACVTMRAAGARLLHRAQEMGEVRGDLTIDELLALGAGLAWASEQAGQPELVDRLLLLVTHGIEPASA